MRLLAVADLHYSLPQFDWVLEVAPDFDVVVLAGDLLELSSIVDRRAQAVVIRKYFERLRAVTRLVICSGNHDLDSPQESGEKVAKWLAASPDDGIITDGESLQLDGILITVCPWWDGPITRAGIAAQLGEAAKTERKLWIWIHHAPPDKSPTSWGGDALFRRHRACAMDRRVQARHRALGPRASVALRQGRLMGRPHRADLGVQCRAAIRRAADAYHHRH